MHYIISLDQGTTSSRAVLFNQQGEVIDICQKAFTQYFPQSAWVEHDPLEILATQTQVLEELLARHTDKTILGLGITNQRETTVVWNKHTGMPVYNAIVWQDRRTSEYCSELKASHGEWIHEKTGLIVDAYFSASKLAWILNQLDETIAVQDLLFGTIDTWLLWNLTDGASHYTDATNASRTLLYNINTKTWDKELLDLFKIPAHVLPEVQPNQYAFGIAQKYQLPILAMAGDQQSALYGQECWTEGTAKNTYGTGCFMLANIGTSPLLSSNGLLTTIAYQDDTSTYYALEGSVFDAGSAIQWLQEGLEILEDTNELTSILEQTPNSGEVYVVPAFSGLGTPYWDMYARGLIIGLTRYSTKHHIIRATLEAIAFQVKLLLTTIEQDAHLKVSTLKVDGGMTKNAWLMQFQADALGQEVQTSYTTEITAWGVALMALQSLGQYTPITVTHTSYQPTTTQDLSYKKWLEAVERALKWVE